MADKNTSNDNTSKIVLPPHPSKQDIRNAILPHVPDIVHKLLYLMENADNDSVKVGAAKTLLNKVVPDLRADELTGKDGAQLDGYLLVRTKGNKPVELAE